MNEKQLETRIVKARKDRDEHQRLGEWRKAETKSMLIIRLEDLLISMQREMAMEGEEVG
jgi:hypothetical protein